MSTITKEFTKEQLQQIIETDHVQCGEASALARIALASLEAEPVAWLPSGGGAKNHVSFDSGNADADPLREVTPLYTAPPEPASVPDEDLLHMAASAIEDLLSNKDRYCAGVWADIPAKLRRAAMLQGADPVQAWIPCSERMPDTMISVLVTGDWFRHAVSFWDGASWCDLDFEPPVTHWQPLPAAPQQEA